MRRPRPDEASSLLDTFGVTFVLTSHFINPIKHSLGDWTIVLGGGVMAVALGGLATVVDTAGERITVPCSPPCTSRPVAERRDRHDHSRGLGAGQVRSRLDQVVIAVTAVAARHAYVGTFAFNLLVLVVSGAVVAHCARW
ncbi:hypothetical protein ACFHW1_27495 [Micromonospora sp. LOL_014]|uniref:hypothetical protein n=1 Tax=Micromonospora sp. LOL_014 TaxID=3345415 RepID=UPI003A8AD461